MAEPRCVPELHEEEQNQKKLTSDTSSPKEEEWKILKNSGTSNALNGDVDLEKTSEPLCPAKNEEENAEKEEQKCQDFKFEEIELEKDDTKLAEQESLNSENIISSPFSNLKSVQQIYSDTPKAQQRLFTKEFKAHPNSHPNLKDSEKNMDFGAEFLKSENTVSCFTDMRVKNYNEIDESGKMEEGYWKESKDKVRIWIPKCNAKQNQGSLLRLFQSEYFNIEMLLNYLFKKREQGIHDYLVNRLYAQTHFLIDFFLPQLW